MKEIDISGVSNNASELDWAKTEMNKKENMVSPEKLQLMRHSASHVLALAVQRLFPDAKMATGPAISNGFYYDFNFSKPPDAKDLKRIETEVEKIKKEKILFVREEVSIEEAKKRLKHQPYKIQLLDIIEETGDTAVVDEGVKAPGEVIIPEKVSLYITGDFVDLCRGPHVGDTSQIGEVKLDMVSAAHWRTSKGTPELTRVYGLCFATKDEMSDYLKKRELAKERDHKKLGPEMDLFMISPEVGAGLTIWLPRGAMVRRAIEEWTVRLLDKYGYLQVYSPHIGRKALWEKSGHWDLYRSKMYAPMKVEKDEYLIKPMTCPIHCMDYAHKMHSYKDLPIRIGEVGSVYRYEQSGELNGLLRVRAFTQDDAHIFCTEDQVVDEFVSTFELIQRIIKQFGFKDYRIRVGIRGDTEKYLGNDKLWQQAQERVIEAVKRTGVDYVIKAGEAAFYGPKADFLLEDAMGREWQCGTVQMDFMLPERFDLKYTDTDGKERKPVMIHRAPLGSLERFFAILLESNGGAFPVWLAPEQVVVIPVADRFRGYAKMVADRLSAKDLRVVLDGKEGTLGKKIRTWEKNFKPPYILVVGDQERLSKTVSVRERESAEKNKVMTIAAFAKKIRAEITSQTV